MKPHSKFLSPRTFWFISSPTTTKQKWYHCFEKADACATLQCLHLCLPHYFYSAVLLTVLLCFPPLIHTWTMYESSKCQLIIECLDCLTIMLSFGPLVSPWGYGVSHSCCWDRLQENSRYSNYILCLSSPQPAASPPEPSPAKLNMHYSNATEV